MKGWALWAPKACSVVRRETMHRLHTRAPPPPSVRPTVPCRAGSRVSGFGFGSIRYIFGPDLQTVNKPSSAR